MTKKVAVKGGARLPLLMAGLAMSQLGLGAELSVTPLLRYTADYQTNRRMVNDTPGQEANGTEGNQFSVGADIAAENERTKISMQPRFDLWRFLGTKANEDFDTENIYVNLDASHFLTERFAMTLGGKYGYDSILTTEGAGGINATTGGGLINAINSRRVARSINPGVRFLLTDRDNLDLGVGYDDVDYEQNTGGLYRDYFNRSATGRWSHRFTDTETFFLDAFVTQFRVPAVAGTSTNDVLGRGNESDNYGFKLNYSSKYWENWTATVGAGVQYTDSKFPVSNLAPLSACLQNGFALQPITLPNNQRGLVCNIVSDQKSDDFGALFNIELARTFEAGRATLGYSRTIGPTGFGTQQTVDVIELSADRGLTERTRGFVEFSYSTAEYSSQSTIGASGRDYYSVGGHLDYKLFEFVNVVAGYYYRSQDFGALGLAADNHALMLSIAYNGDKRSFYR